MRKFLYFINICFGVILLVSYLSPWINPEKFDFITLFGLLFPAIVLVNLLFVIFWIFIKPKFSLLSIFCLLIGYQSIGGLLQWGNEEISDANLHVMSYNIRDLQLDPNNKKLFKDLYQYFMVDSEFDVICVQEKMKSNKSMVNKIFKHLHTVENEHGMAIFSKDSIIDSGILKVGGNTFEAIWANIKHKNGHLYRIYSYHLSSNLITKKTDALIEEVDLSEKTWVSIKGILGSYAQQAKKRTTQLERLLEHANQSPYPVILAGDMNDVPQSYVYRLLRKNRKDTFREKGSGFGSSFGYRYPLLRIDYIFPDKNFEVASHHIDRVKFSDHYPISSQLIFEP